jgi:Tfp pilus assembly protein PilP
MMRTLGTLILLSAAAFAQTPTAVQNPAAPAAVSVQPATNKAQAGKPSPNGAKASTTSAAPKAKATVSAKATSAAKPGTPAQKSISVKPAVSTAKAASAQASAKPVLSNPKVNPISTGTKGASTVPAAKAVSAKVATAKAAGADAKVKVPAAKAAVVGVLSKPAVVAVTKGASQPNSVSVKSNASTGPAVAHVVTKPVGVRTGPKAATHTKVAVAKLPAPKQAAPVQDGKPVAENKQASTEIHTAGRRDPFLSPVVAMGATGSGCSAGKRCLTIDQIALKGVVKSESGMIAVVTNALDKAYFLRENDPVFNGYVVKITGDSIIFKETFHDRLGKALTRDVTKSITRPVA